MSTRAVAGRVGCSSPALYLHFPDRASLLWAACNRQFVKLGELVRDAVAGIDDPVEALKAAGYATAVGEWVLAEDSGLVVPALKGRPGVHSARYAGTRGDDAANNRKVLAELAPLPDDRRAAYYVCVAALASPAPVDERMREVVLVITGREVEALMRPP